MSSEAKDVYDFYKGSIPLYFSLALFFFTPILTGSTARILSATFGLAGIIICWVRQSRLKLYFDNNQQKRQLITQGYKFPKLMQKQGMAIILCIALGASTVGILKFNFGYYQFVGLGLSITMGMLGLTNLFYLPYMRRHYRIAK